MEYVWDKTIKWIPGYENRYAATVDGQVASYVYKPKFLSQYTNGRGYLCIGLSDKKTTVVHKLVYWAFKGKPTTGFQIHHIDGNKDNNNILNLAAYSVREHKSKHHKFTPRYRCDLGSSLVAVLRFLHYKRFLTRGKISSIFGVDEATLSDALCGKTFKHIPLHPSKEDLKNVS